MSRLGIGNSRKLATADWKMMDIRQLKSNYRTAAFGCNVHMRHNIARRNTLLPRLHKKWCGGSPLRPDTSKIGSPSRKAALQPPSALFKGVQGFFKGGAGQKLALKKYEPQVRLCFFHKSLSCDQRLAYLTLSRILMRAARKGSCPSVASLND